MKREHTGIALLMAAVLVSGLAVVYVKHQSRKLFVQLQALQEQQDAMNVEWGRLQLEQSALATHGYVERTARKQLGMHMPSPEDIVIVRP